MAVAMAAFRAVFTFGGSGPALSALRSFDLKQEIRIQIPLAAAAALVVLKITDCPDKTCISILR
jgi:hypothetical protein